eukprot:243630-Chlamydomonas_euryale.AAC.8
MLTALSLGSCQAAFRVVLSCLSSQFGDMIHGCREHTWRLMQRALLAAQRAQTWPGKGGKEKGGKEKRQGGGKKAHWKYAKLPIRLDRLPVKPYEDSHGLFPCQALWET